MSTSSSPVWRPCNNAMVLVPPNALLDFFAEPMPTARVSAFGVCCKVVAGCGAKTVASTSMVARAALCKHLNMAAVPDLPTVWTCRGDLLAFGLGTCRRPPLRGLLPDDVGRPWLPDDVGRSSVFEDSRMVACSSPPLRVLCCCGLPGAKTVCSTSSVFKESRMVACSSPPLKVLCCCRPLEAKTVCSTSATVAALASSSAPCKHRSMACVLDLPSGLCGGGLEAKAVVSTSSSAFCKHSNNPCKLDPRKVACWAASAPA
mmetsp:Transcript_23820/g.75210  ORF Transcript_23820/g.75210 Transcript_23820/m.75210 type:complete len:260 (-) Transcript_23820:49-828(-)